MSLRLETLQVARLAKKSLGESWLLVREFLRGQQAEDGGFRDRDGCGDLYYTVFGLDGVKALEGGTGGDGASECPGGIRDFLDGYGEGEGLDFVHLASLVRCRAAAGMDNHEVCRSILKRLEMYRTNDGGYHQNEDGGGDGRDRGGVGSVGDWGTVYGCYLALGAYQDARVEMPDGERLLDCLNGLRSEDGGWSNERGMRQGMTTATGAAVGVMRQFGEDVGAEVGEWLLKQHFPDGGFRAFPGAPMPDLLSTAVGLHALSSFEGVECEAIVEPCLDFIDSLWEMRGDSEGGFYGHWGDDAMDCEYSYYGLLALGHLWVMGEHGSK